MLFFTRSQCKSVMPLFPPISYFPFFSECTQLRAVTAPGNSSLKTFSSPGKPSIIPIRIFSELRPLDLRSLNTVLKERKLIEDPIFGLVTSI